MADVRETEPPQSSPFHPLSLEHHADAAGRLAAARECPVTYPMDMVAVVSRYADVRSVLRDDTNFTCKGNFNIESDATAGPVPFILEMDPPEHSALRSRFLNWFSPGKLRGLKPRIESIVDAVLDDVDTSGDFDLYRTIARQVPTRVLYTVCGFPERDWDFLQECDDAIVAHVPRPLDECKEFGQVAEYMAKLVAERMEQPPTGAARRDISRSAAASTRVSVRPWPAWRQPRSSAPCSSAIQTCAWLTAIGGSSFRTP